MKTRFASLFILQLFFAEDALSQTSRSDPSDQQARYGATLSLDLPKKWGVDFTYQERYRNDFKDFRGGYLSIGPQREIFKNFTVLTEYRIAWLSGATYHRVTAGASYKHKLHTTKLSLRALVQNQMEEFDDADKTDRHDIYWRVKLGAQQPIFKRWDIFASIEPVMMVNGIDFVNNWRTTVGVKYKIIKRLEAEVYYLNKQDYAKSYDREFHIFGVGLEYVLKL